MKIGEKIKETRKAKGISVEYLAKELGISKTTIYRYENEDIGKIPVETFDRICKLLGVTPAQLMGNVPNDYDNMEIFPQKFDDPEEAMKFLLRIPTIAAFGGYDPTTMDDDTILNFANDLLRQLELVSHKYR